VGFVGILVPTPPAPPAWAGRRSTTLVSRAGVTTLTVTSPEVTHSNLERNWTQVARPGAVPFLRDAGPKLRSWQITATLYADLQDVAGDLDTIVHGHAQADRLTVTYGRLEAVEAVLTRVSIHTIARIPGTNEPRWAELELEFTERPADLKQVVPAAAPSSAPPPPPAAPSPSAPKARTVTVKRGDTLFAIAQRVYGNGSKWPAIASANGIRNPKNVAVGKVLRIP
jgi:nucleoid-associated protein YgaU